MDSNQGYEMNGWRLTKQHDFEWVDSYGYPTSWVDVFLVEWMVGKYGMAEIQCQWGIPAELYHRRWKTK
jgi:hypothetical protein